MMVTDKQVASLLSTLEDQEGVLRTDHSRHNRNNLEIIAEAERRGLVETEIDVHYEQQWSEIIVTRLDTSKGDG